MYVPYTEADRSTRQQIQVLMLLVFNQPCLGCADVEAADEAADPRAELVLQLLLTSLEQPAPNLSHLLCGFDFESGEFLVVSAPHLSFFSLLVYAVLPVWSWRMQTACLGHTAAMPGCQCAKPPAMQAWDPFTSQTPGGSTTCCASCSTPCW